MLPHAPLQPLCWLLLSAMHNRQQVLDFGSIALPAEHAIELDTSNCLEPTWFHTIDTMPVHPITVGGHINIDRWIKALRDGFLALSLIFNCTTDRVCFDIGAYIFCKETHNQYIQIYGDQHDAFFYNTCQAFWSGEDMSDNFAQFMVNMMGTTLILCQLPSSEEHVSALAR